jgi:sulfur relay (sulfurtransferase) complex TusBCD TusD component (DsrE family)
LNSKLCYKYLIMKRVIIFILFIGYLLPGIRSQTASGCVSISGIEAKKPVKIGIVIYSNDPETVWNALRIANYSLSEKDTVSVFLMGKGVEIKNLSTKDYDVGTKLNDFLDSGGKIFACGTCMSSRNMRDSKACPISSLSDLYEIIRSSDKLLTF